MHTLQISVFVLVVLIGLALLFDFMNGFHDAANAIATVVSTRVLKPHTAVAMAAVCNFIAVMIFPLTVAATVGKDTVDPMIVDQYVIFGALVGAVFWNFVTWYFGIPSSSSHALIGGLVGAAVAKSGTGALIAGGLIKIVIFIVLSPLLGFVFGSIMMVLVSWMFVGATPRRVDKWFRHMQLLSASMYSLGHGGNDAQKTIGIIWMLLIAAGQVKFNERVPNLGDRQLLYVDQPRHAVRRLAHRQDDGSENHQVEAGGRLLRRNRRRHHLVHRHRAGRAGLDHAYDYRRHRRRRLRAENVGSALGSGRQYRVGVDLDDPGFGVCGGDCLVDRHAGALNRDRIQTSACGIF